MVSAGMNGTKGTWSNQHMRLHKSCRPQLAFYPFMINDSSDQTIIYLITFSSLSLPYLDSRLYLEIYIVPI